MDKKKFSLYTEEEREKLLMHWWYYYGKSIVSLAEIEQFQDLVKKDSILMGDVAMISYMLGVSSQHLIGAMRAGVLAEYLGMVKKITGSDDYKVIGEELEQKFLNEVVGTYNNPEADVPFSQEEIVSQMIGIVSEKEAILTSKSVHDVYRKCLLTDMEVTDDGPTVDFIIGEGINEISLFSAERLGQNKDEIITLIDELPNIEEGMSFLDMCCDKHGRQWTGEYRTMDVLVQLGVATGILEYCVPREKWETLPEKMPYIIRNKENDRAKVFGKRPFEYKQTVEDLKTRLSK